VPALQRCNHWEQPSAEAGFAPQVGGPARVELHRHEH
jgi:hypothetical protein